MGQVLSREETGRITDDGAPGPTERTLQPGMAGQSDARRTDTLYWKEPRQSSFARHDQSTIPRSWAES
jgi:hypothetical protein